MTERTTNEAVQPILVEQGVVYKPFEDLPSLPLPDRDNIQTYVEEVNYLLSRDLRFVGGALATIAIEIPEDVSYRHFQIPLGRATKEFEYDDKETLVKTPLGIVTFATLRSLDEYLALDNFRFQFKMTDPTYTGDSFYFMDCVEQFNKKKRSENIAEAEEIIQHGMAQWGGGHFVNNKLRDPHGNDVNIMLPYDAKKLSTIEVSVVRKPNREVYF